MKASTGETLPIKTAVHSGGGIIVVCPEDWPFRSYIVPIVHAAWRRFADA